MLINGYHLSYCTNIHPGENWEETFQNLKEYLPKVKKEVAPKESLGLGLRLSDIASRDLMQGDNLELFKSWLEENSCYVFTLNGFPFGGFHHQTVKDQVHHPDWTTQARQEYTLRLFGILKNLLPHQAEGGISTSPLSYKFWPNVLENRERVLKEATQGIIEVAEQLYRIHKEEDKLLHLDIEPEPDGLLENTAEVIHWFKDWLLPQGGSYLQRKMGLAKEEAESCLKEHIRICYDVCHFAIVYEEPENVFSSLEREGIKIGKIQISAALKARLPAEMKHRELVKTALSPFAESTYLHQVVERDSKGQMTQYRDLPQALEKLQDPAAKEWRIHFHVPVFLQNYGQLESTQKDVLDVFNYLRKKKVTNHLEVETYTWEVLPKDIQLELKDSIVRELQWIRKNL